MWLYEWLYKERITQEELAKLIGISRTRLNLIMTGKATPSPRTAKLIQDITKGQVCIEDLLYGKIENKQEYRKKKDSTDS